MDATGRRPRVLLCSDFDNWKMFSLRGRNNLFLLMEAFVK